MRFYDKKSWDIYRQNT